MRKFGLGKPRARSNPSALRLGTWTVCTRLYAWVSLFSAPITQGIDQQGKDLRGLPTARVVQVIA